MALVIVLVMLVLVIGLVVAFISLALSGQQAVLTSSSNLRVPALAETAMQFVLSDLLSEIDAGSEADPLATNSAIKVNIKNPILVTQGTNSYAPSMVPQRVADDGIANIVKKSRHGSRFFTGTTGYQASTQGPDRAANVGTDEASTSGHSMTLQRWNKPLLMTDEELTSFQAPDWIYLDRQGKNPTSFTTQDLTELRNSDPNNPKYVLGRYAYVIYDVGGLIDINVVGNALDGPTTPPAEIQNARRGRLHQVSLKNGIGSVKLPNFDEFVAWRSAATKANQAQLFDSKRTFINTLPGDQTFVNRQDLLNYIASGSAIPREAAPYLTTYSRDINAPSYAPDPNRSKMPVPADADSFNPSLLAQNVRFQTDTTLARPDGPITVPAGTPVMPRRFPLSKLALFEQENPDPAEMLYYFGLTKDSVSGYKWKYTKDISGRIARLDEVASQGREPNFFEILQGVVYHGSLGRHAGPPPGATKYLKDNSHNLSYIFDSKQDLQVLQIGANIIDQWDSKDIPTTIIAPFTARTNQLAEVTGVENLPYINQVNLVPWRPAHFDRKRFQLWALFDLWNPHQNAKTIPLGCDGLRIIATEGQASTRVSIDADFKNLPNRILEFSMADGGAEWTPKISLGGATDYDDIVDLNDGKSVEISLAADYSEPVTPWKKDNPPTENDWPGILLADYDLSQTPYYPIAPQPDAAIPAKTDRPKAIQDTLTFYYDRLFPYTATHPDGRVIRSGTKGPETLQQNAPDFAALEIKHADGSRQYPVDSQITPNTAGNLDYWVVNGTTIYAEAGTKSHNFVRFSPKPNFPVSFELQALVNGRWVKVQRVESWFNQSDTFNAPGEVFEKISTNTWKTNTHHTVSGWTESGNNFYQWKGHVRTMYRYDPRSSRFGLSSAKYSTAPGRTQRAVDTPWDGKTSDVEGFLIADGGRKAGLVADSDPTTLVPGWHAWLTTQNKESLVAPYGLVSNHPTELNANHPMRYDDMDEVTRPADGYWGALPTVKGRLSERPLILNRPFRSVGELGYVFRDLPWKTLDFSTNRSGDLGLLDVFSLDETPGSTPLVAGKINLNTRRPEVLAPVLEGTAMQFSNTAAGIAATTTLAAEAPGVEEAGKVNAIAKAITTESKLHPFMHRGELISRALGSIDTAAPHPLGTAKTKAEREAAMRTLSEIGTTRTWNFLIDLVVQEGRFTQASKNGSEFLVQGERRYWVHVAIDRLTGTIVDMQKESYDE